MNHWDHLTIIHNVNSTLTQSAHLSSVQYMPNFMLPANYLYTNETLTKFSTTDILKDLQED